MTSLAKQMDVNPALEFVKSVCKVLSLDDNVTEQVIPNVVIDLIESSIIILLATFIYN